MNSITSLKSLLSQHKFVSSPLFLSQVRVHMHIPYLLDQTLFTVGSLHRNNTVDRDGLI